MAFTWLTCLIGDEELTGPGVQAQLSIVLEADIVMGCAGDTSSCASVGIDPVQGDVSSLVQVTHSPFCHLLPSA